MRKLRGRLSFANVMSVIAVFIALGGSSYAISKLPKNSVGTKQLKKNSVTTAKIADQAITAAKIENGVLAGGQPNAPTPGTVPEATHAVSADNAGHATNADTANTLDGLKAGDFAAAADIQTPSRTVVDDLGPGDASFRKVALIKAGAFEISGECAKDLIGSGTDFVVFTLDAPAGSSISGSVNASNTNKAVIVSAASSGNALASAEVTAVAPSGQVVMVRGSVELNDPAGDCIFGVTVVGP